MSRKDFPQNRDKRMAKRAKREVVLPNGQGAFRISDCDPAILHDLLSQLHDAGCAVMLTRTSDGNVLGIRCYHDELTVKTIWCNSEDALVAAGEAVLRALQD